MDALGRPRRQPQLFTAFIKPPAPCVSGGAEFVVANEPLDAEQPRRDQRGTCPQCRVVLEWPSDAYRTECKRCATIYCWACGTHLNDEHEDDILHLQWWNNFGCQGLDKPKRAGYRSWDVMVLQLVMGVFAGLPAFVCGILVGIVTCAYVPSVLCCRTPHKHAFLLTVNMFGSLLLFVVVPAWVLVMLPFYPIVWGYRRCFPPEHTVKDWLW